MCLLNATKNHLKDMETIKISCFVDRENFKAVLNLPEVTESGITYEDIAPVSEIVIDPDTLMGGRDGSDDVIAKFKNNLIGAAILTVMQLKDMEKRGVIDSIYEERK